MRLHTRCTDEAPSRQLVHIVLEVSIPGRNVFRLCALLIDFNGTLARDGSLLPGVGTRLARLRACLAVEVLTADTFGTAQRVLAHTRIPCTVIRDGRDKAARVIELDPTCVAVIGNGQNDVAMFESAALSIAVLGPEGLAGDALKAADIIVPSVVAALDLLLKPRRLQGTLRN